MTKAIIRSVQETSLMSWIVVEPLTGERQLEVFNVLAHEDRPMTSREILCALGRYDMNYVRPRITELHQMGRIRSCGVTFDPITRRTVLLWEVIKKL